VADTTPTLSTGRIAKRSRKTILKAVLDARKAHGGDKRVVLDADGRELTYDDLVKAAFALGGPLARRTKRGENVGVLLPTGAGAVIAMLALMTTGRTPAMLNFTSGPRAMKGALEAAEIRTVVTARKFVEIGKLEKLIEQLSEHVEIVYLEDVREKLSIFDKLRALAGLKAPGLVAANVSPDAPGLVLFTSGTEGLPKGVVLAHSNVVANVTQIDTLVSLEPTDVVFNPLPIFHCYGLTAGTMFPLLTGAPVALHPSPLQVKAIPKRIAETKSTILFATDTFLQQYMRSSDDEAMKSLRIAVCGAERVRDETREAARRRFAFTVLEGYGVTEAAPVVSVNHPDDVRAGTVGRLFLDIEPRLEPVEGMPDAGRLFTVGRTSCSAISGRTIPASSNARPRAGTTPATSSRSTGKASSRSAAARNASPRSAARSSPSPSSKTARRPSGPIACTPPSSCPTRKRASRSSSPPSARRPTAPASSPGRRATASTSSPSRRSSSSSTRSPSSAPARSTT